jgi:beta-N-acetylhexosaminidase
LREPFTEVPCAAQIGRTGDVNVARRIGELIGRELCSVGIDIDYAPVLDVHSNPENPVIGDRAFAADPAAVGRFGVAMMRGLMAGGVIPCGKHFPGHGDTPADSHFELPVVERSRARLERTELAPFRAAIAAGIPMIMTAHVRYPSLDRTCAATVSPRIINRLLRQQMNFRGVVASDDLHMSAISANQSIAKAAVASLAAGVDWLLVCHDLGEAQKAAEAIRVAIDDGVLPQQLVIDASRRIAALMERHARRRKSTRCRFPNTAHRKLVRELFGNAETAS